MSSIYKICDEEGGGGGEEGRGAPITQLIAAPPARRITKLWLRENNKNNFRKNNCRQPSIGGLFGIGKC